MREFEWAYLLKKLLYSKIKDMANSHETSFQPEKIIFHLARKVLNFPKIGNK
jgi:hypothetical protein